MQPFDVMGNSLLPLIDIDNSSLVLRASEIVECSDSQHSHVEQHTCVLFFQVLVHAVTLSQKKFICYRFLQTTYSSLVSQQTFRVIFNIAFEVSLPSTEAFRLTRPVPSALRTTFIPHPNKITTALPFR